MTKKQFISLFILSLIIALCFFFIPSSFLSIIYFRFIAVCFILMGIIKLAFINKRSIKREKIFNYVEGILAVLMGQIYFYFYEYLVIDVICFLVLLIVPMLRLIYAELKINQAGFDALKYIGLLSLLAGYSLVNKPFFIFCGSLWILIAIALLCIYVRGLKKDEQEE